MIRDSAEHWNKNNYSQVELLVPDWVQFLRYCFCSLLDLADLDCDVGVRGATLVLSDETLCADNCTNAVHRGVSRTLHTVLSAALYTQRCQQHPTHCTVSSSLHTALSAALYTLHCQQHSTHCTISSSPHTALSAALYTLHCQQLSTHKYHEVYNQRILNN